METGVVLLLFNAAMAIARAVVVRRICLLHPQSGQINYEFLELILHRDFLDTGDHTRLASIQNSSWQ